MKIVIIIPTYNEKDTIGKIIDQIITETKTSKYNIHILVVDDNSPDGTGNIVEDLKKSNDHIHLLSGQKQGLGAAYIRGFHEAIENLQADVVFEMDADGSHPPEYIIPMLKAIENGGDVAVGTRFTKGGSIPANWGFIRKLQSVFGNIIARVVLLLPQYHDITTGFRATKTSVLKNVDYDRLLSKKFAYKIHLFFLLDKSKSNIIEVPFAFVDREEGYSKMPRNEILESLRVVFTIRVIESWQMIKFLIVGTIGFLVNAFFLKVFYDTSVGFFLPQPQIHGQLLFLQLADIRLFLASVLSAELSIVSNFILNENWTFKSRDKSGNIAYRFGRFNASSVVSPIISIATVNILTPHFGVPKILALAIGTVIGLIWNYSVNVLWIWRAKPSNTISE